eukprot:363221-Chlamydomonas_euryale.AAC.18
MAAATLDIAATVAPHSEQMAPADGTSPLRILFLTLEFSAATFSGNGIYAQSQVRALSALGHSVFVISAAPHSHDRESGANRQGAAHLEQVCRGLAPAASCDGMHETLTMCMHAAQNDSLIFHACACGHPLHTQSLSASLDQQGIL